MDFFYLSCRCLHFLWTKKKIFILVLRLQKSRTILSCGNNESQNYHERNGMTIRYDRDKHMKLERDIV